MTDLSIRMADTARDHDIARELCREWLDWHWNAYPQDWPVENNPMDPQKFEVTLTNLPEIHARPGGGILIASLNGEAVGCVMYNESEPGVAVFNRMFVAERGRGHGIGAALLERLFEAMRADGYGKVIFSSATFLTHARRMYQNAGFTAIPPPPGFPDTWRPYVYFMQRAL